MSDAYQSIRLGGDDRNAESLGDFVGWLVSNNLLDPALEAKAGSEAARVKMQDLTGPEFLTTVLHGELKPEHLNDDGQKFCEFYLATGDYDRDYQLLEYVGDNEWFRFDEISKRIGDVYRTFSQPKAPLKKLAAKVIQFPGRKK